MVTGALTAGSVAGGLLAPFAGRLADRFGPRALMPTGALVVGGAFLALARIGSLWHLYVAYVVARALSTNAMAGVVPLTAVTNWFVAKRGRAMGLTTMALPLGASALAFTSQLIIEASSWRNVYSLLALMTWVLVVAPSWIVMRRSPEDLGLLPDGESPAQVSGSERESPKEGVIRADFSWTVSEAVRTQALWLIISSFFAALLANGSIGFHQVAYFTDMGISAKVAASVLSVYALSGAISNFTWGFLAEKFHERRCAIIANFLSAAAVAMLIFIRSAPLAYLWAVCFGLAARGEGELINLLIGRYYGRGSFGSISGVVVPFQMLALGLGPLIAAAAYDLTGSYSGVFTMFVFTYVISGFLVLMAKPPKLPERAYSQEALAQEPR
ncbi:MAG: hypothetical protein HW389_44 [Bacteroidetes bacterium]|nr:hypothetical protein [Bacteroidota bacterium]MBM2826898.1 hypothetical protein [Dehalococcoidia bacterium]